MNHSRSGFSDVDASENPEDLVGYLGLLATVVGEIRRGGYALAGLRAGQAVLDVGCGAGEVCVELHGIVGPTGRVTGVDLSSAMIEAARATTAKAGLSIELQVASAYQLPFPDGSFDVVRAERVFQHLDAPEAALREMMRVTRRGGQILVVDPDHGQASLALDDPAHRRVFEVLRRTMLSMIVNPHSGVRLRPMMFRAGLLEVRQRLQPLEIPHAAFGRAFFLDRLLEKAVADGAITAAEGDAFVAELAAREQRGEFQALAIGYSVVGTR
jgi:SAM-dependent methyltransferase